MSKQLTYAQVADRIEAVLGERRALSALRAGATRERTATGLRNRITAGMPAPTPGAPGSPSLFDEDEIEAWLAQHPRREWVALREQLVAASPADRPAVVSRARAAGMSWRAIADIVNAADGTTWTRQWAQQKYGRRSG